VHISETIPTTKWFRIEMWRRERKKIGGQKSYGGVREIWGVLEKFGGCMRNFGGAREI
jgi:hypothetical protein